MRKVPRNDDGGDGDEIEGTLPIFKHPGRPYCGPAFFKVRPHSMGKTHFWCVVGKPF